MFRRENNFPLVVTAAVLTLATLVTFQIYQWREPARLEADAAADLEAAVAAGEELYTLHCTSCHGESGEGLIGPALNSKDLLEAVSDAQIGSLILTGVPGTAMPAWGQNYGGPLTDEEVRQIVAYVRSWEPVVVESVAHQPDPVRGAEIFGSVCFVCHGSDGKGTDRAPALNDPVRLNTFDDLWYRNTIAEGRPSRGMPTWGTVLSPAEIDDLVALFATWRQGEAAALPEPVSGPAASGEELYSANCAACHGQEGEGGIGTVLQDNDFISGQTDEALIDFLLAGREGTIMAGFEGRLGSEEVALIVDLIRNWQP